MIRSLGTILVFSEALCGLEAPDAPPTALDQARLVAAEVRKEFLDDPRAVIAAAAVEHRGGAVDRALELYREALRRDRSLAEAREAAGDILTQKGRLAEALLEYSAALEGPASGEARALLRLKRALALFQLGRTAECERDLEDGVRAHPESAPLRYLLAQILLLRRDPAGAIQHLQVARDLGERRASVEYALSRAHFLSGNKGAGDEALARFREAREAVLKGEEFRRLRNESRAWIDRRNLALAHLDAAAAFRRHERSAEARSHLEEALRADGELSAARLLLARLCEETGDLERAAEESEILLRGARDPGPLRKFAASIYIQRARALLADPIAAAATGRLPDALAWARRALDLDPSAEACEAAAWACLALGDRARGIEYLREAARLDPGNTEHQRRLRALEKN